MKNLLSIFKEDMKSDEIGQNLYLLHYVAALVLTTLLVCFYTEVSNFPTYQAIIFSIIVNALLWFSKEMIWGFIDSKGKDSKFFVKLSKFSILGFRPFQWSQPDWRDWRFSIYGSIPFTIIFLIYFQISKNE